MGPFPLEEQGLRGLRWQIIEASGEKEGDSPVAGQILKIAMHICQTGNLGRS